MGKPGRWRRVRTGWLSALGRRDAADPAAAPPCGPAPAEARDREAPSDSEAARWRRVKEIFQAAIERDPDARLAFVAAACAGQASVEQAVRTLLAAHEEAHDFLESSGAVDRAAAALLGHEAGPPALSAGARLGPYEVQALLEAGGMGEVYRARDTRLGRDVALKVLRAGHHADPDRLRRLAAEARAAAAISDPNVVAVFDVGSSRGVPYVISELLEGETLGQRLRRARLGWRECVSYGVQIARGLAAAHARDVVHRDLKPDNVFVTRQGVLKLLDFGVAKLMHDGQAGEAAPAGLRSGPQSTSLGTPGYVAPEQLEGRPVDQRADIFALGVVLSRMLTGQPAFADTDAAAEASAPGPRPLLAGNGAPPALERLVRRCLERRPEDRFQSADEVRLALQALVEPSRGRGAWALRAGLAALALIALAWLGDLGGLRARLRPSGVRSLAILPLEDPSGDPSQAYFADGLTEALITQVARTHGLRVISRASVMGFRLGQPASAEAARRLGVEAVLAGSVRRSGQGVRVAVRLERGADGRRLWQATYERPLHELPLLLREVSSAVVAQISPGAPARDESSTPPRSVETYEAYLRGRYYWNLRSSESLPRAIEQFNQALQLDPLYAPAHAGLADSFATLGDMLYLMPHRDAFARAEAAARRALELDPSQAEAHATLGHMHMHAWRWDQAEREFQRALELNPGYAPAHQWRAYNLASLGRMDAAVAAARRAEHLDPLSPVIGADLAQVLYFAGRPAEAVAQCRQTLQMNPSFAEGRRVLFLALLGQHRDDEAARELAAFARLPDGGPGGSVGYALAALARRSEALHVLAQLQRRPQGQFVPPYDLAVIHAGLGQGDAAFARLEQALATHDPESMLLPVDPRLAGLRADPRFAQLRRRMGLPPSP